jgi:hypothetical protein
VAADTIINVLTVHGSESTALTTGSEGKQFQDKAWTEILEVLETQAPEVRSIVQL